MNGITEFDPINALTTLLTGPGADNFRKLEAIADVFCPFEAIGMTQQEIRHAHYLAYLLDPHRPHGFGDKFLSETVRLFADTAGKSAPSPLYLHLADLGQARILRERDDIDLRIEIPKSGAMHKNCVFIIEMKIGADEGKGQLEKYEKIAKAQYDGWDIVHVFLTPEASEASREDWTPVGFHALLEAYETRLTRENLTGEPANLLRAWIAMLRRHVLQNEELENLITAIWREHGEALDLLMEHRPDFTLDVLDAFKASFDRETPLIGTDTILSPETHARRIARLAIRSWDALKWARIGNGKWLRVGEGRVFSIEVEPFEKNGTVTFRTALVMGPVEGEENTARKQEMFDALKKKGQITGRKVNTGVYQHIAKHDLKVFQNGSYSKVQNAADDLKKEFCDYWSEKLPEIEEILRPLLRN